MSERVREAELTKALAMMLYAADRPSQLAELAALVGVEDTMMDQYRSALRIAAALSTPQDTDIMVALAKRLNIYHDGPVAKNILIQFTNANDANDFLTAAQDTPPTPSAEPVAPCNWQTFGPGGPLQAPVRVCVHCGSLDESALCRQTTTPPAAAQDTARLMARGLKAVAALIAESRGVAGLHLNGDEARWDELRAGGRYEEWLVDFDNAMNAARAAGGE